VNEDGTLNKKAQGVVDYLESYAELSPSGRGIHIFVFAHLPGPGRKLAGYEMYEDKRYITITGQHIDSSPLQIAAEQEKLTRVYKRIFANKTDNTIPQRTMPHAKQRVNSRQSELNIQEQADRIIAYGIKTNTNFRRYFEGDEILWGDGKVNPTKSEADWKLCLMLAYRTYPKRDHRLERIALMDEIFRQSRLYDEKWDSRREHTTYGMITIEKAIGVNDEKVEKKQRF
jgi:putative DNA primase/helicase